MHSKKEKSFYAGIAIGSKNLSSCEEPKGAILVQDSRILAHGYNKKVIPDKTWEVSAIFDTLFGVRDLDVSGSSLFVTHFPDLNDLLLVVSIGVSYLYFTGKINNPDTVKLMNDLPNSGISLEIIQLG